MITPLISAHEHYNSILNDSEELNLLSKTTYSSIFKTNRREDYYCYTLRKEDNYHLKTSYFIGVDWLETRECAIYITPKLNKIHQEINYIKMLFNCMQNQNVSNHIKDLYIIKWNEPKISITQQEDLLTLFLITEFLGLLKSIVRKGLKKSYYKVERKLNNRIKGKINISKTIRHQLTKQRTLETVCTYDEFGVDNLENRVLKKTMKFITHYLSNFKSFYNSDFLISLTNFINPAFEKVSANVSVREIKTIKPNAFFKEYDQGIRLAKIILRRFGYNVTNTSKLEIKTPPFWIDMSRLFELYVLGLLFDRFGSDVTYHPKFKGNELDYLLNSIQYKMVIDAKYKPQMKDKVNHQDIRQVSGYARLEEVYKKLYDIRELNNFEKLNLFPLVDCLIIYPDQKNGLDNLSLSTDNEELNLKEMKINQYKGVYKLGIKLPTLSLQSTSIPKTNNI